MKKSVIVCDECNNEFNPHEIEFKTAKAKIEEKEYDTIINSMINQGE